MILFVERFGDVVRLSWPLLGIRKGPVELHPTESDACHASAVVKALRAERRGRREAAGKLASV